jgi:outer membrane protein with beta-barrel domain
MTRVLRVPLALVVAALAGVSPVAAQNARFGLGGGLTMPIRDYKTSDDAGWHLFGKVDIGIPMSPLGVRVDGMYAQTTKKSPATGNTKLAGGTAGLVWNVAAAIPGLKPYVVGGVGFYNVNAGGRSETKFAWGAGLGTSIGVGPMHGFAEARYMSVHLGGGAVRFVPVTVGVSFGS